MNGVEKLPLTMFIRRFFEIDVETGAQDDSKSEDLNSSLP